MTQKPYRQGDVLIIPLAPAKARDVSKLEAISRENGLVILAHGEVTGHSHKILSQDCNLYFDMPTRLDTEDEIDGEAVAGMQGLIARLGGGQTGPVVPDRILDVKAPVALSHEEHDTIPIPVGQYIIRQQREFDPEAERAVAD